MIEIGLVYIFSLEAENDQALEFTTGSKLRFIWEYFTFSAIYIFNNFALPELDMRIEAWEIEE